MPNVEIINVQAVGQAIGGINAALIPMVRPVLERWLLRRIGPLARYPSPPPMSRYRRTGTLGRRWTSAQPTWNASAAAWSVRLGNNTPYAPFVQGRQQARVHAGRWRTVEAEVSHAEPQLLSDITMVIQQLETDTNRITA